MKTGRSRLTCKAVIARGPNRGTLCARTANMIVVQSCFPVCAIHARAYVDWALARLAYWNPKERAWL